MGLCSTDPDRSAVVLMLRPSYTSSSRNQRSRRSISIAVGHYFLTTIVVIAILITLALVSTEVHSFSFSSAQSMKRAFFAPSSSRFIIRGVSNNAVAKSSQGLNLAVHVEYPAKDSTYLPFRCFYPKRSSSALSTRLFGSSIDNTNSNNMSTNNSNMNEKIYQSASALTEQLAIRLIQGDELQTDTSNLKPTKACIAIAGGGSNAASAIASTPGASSLLLESIVTYDRRSYAEFVSQNVGDDIGLLNDLESILVGGGGTATDSAASGESSAASSKSTGDSSQYIFQFSSTEAAILLSRSALNRSLQLTPSFQDQSLHCIGVGCTSSLVGKTSPYGEAVNGRKGRRSRAYIAISTLREGIVWEVRLDGNNDKKTNGGVRRRSRSEEEAVISNLLLSSMIQYRKGSTGLSKDVSQILNRDGDSIERTLLDGGSFKEGGKSPAAGASQIINGNTGAVVVLPVAQQHLNAEQPGEQEKMEAIFSDSGIPFPRDILIVPGSFNPPHQGHIGLANAAVAALRRLRQRDSVDSNSNNNDAINTPSSRSYSRYSSLSSVSSSSSSILKNLWDTVDQYSEEQYDPTVFFEMSVTNADKPPLDPSEVDRRVGMFTSILPTSEMPKDWGVILTNAPLFSQKTSTLDDLIPRSFDGNRTSRRMSFVLGTDTMVRIINQKYYGNNRDNMIAALVDMQKKGVHFIVGGRLEQGTDNT